MIFGCDLHLSLPGCEVRQTVRPAALWWNFWMRRVTSERWGCWGSCHGSRMSRFELRLSCVSVVSRQTERGTCVSEVLMMLNDVRCPYVRLLDSSESIWSVSSLWLTSPRPWQSTLKLVEWPSPHEQLVGQFIVVDVALNVNCRTARKIVRASETTFIIGWQIIHFCAGRNVVIILREPTNASNNH